MIGLVGCGKQKRLEAAPARDLYTGQLFRKSLAYAEARCAVVWILSAQGGLLRLDQEVAPYDVTIKTKAQRAAWGLRVWDQFKAQHREPGDLLLLAGDAYAEPIRSRATLARWSVLEPLHGMEIGERLRFLKFAENGGAR